MFELDHKNWMEIHQTVKRKVLMPGRETCTSKHRESWKSRMFGIFREQLVILCPWSGSWRAEDKARHVESKLQKVTFYTVELEVYPTRTGRVVNDFSVGRVYLKQHLRKISLAKGDRRVWSGLAWKQGDQLRGCGKSSEYTWRELQLGFRPLGWRDFAEQRSNELGRQLFEVERGEGENTSPSF